MLGLPVGTQMTYEEASRLIDGAAFNPLDDGQWSGAYRLEHVHLEWNRGGFPEGCEYDSRCMLEAEASMHGTSLFA